jgi:TolB-like protein/DNA-binding winged helix-turn-helix (wHTH) protein
VPACIYKFGDFELDPSRFELKKNGRVLKLERIPMDLLILLAEKEGSVATRREIIERLWGKDVFVDTEHGINTAIRKIRMALREDAERPRFVQTVPGKGYRFLAEVGNSDANAGLASVPQLATPVAHPAAPSDIEQAVAVSSPLWRVAMAVVFALVVVSGIVEFNARGLWDRLSSKHQIAPIHSIAVLPLANLSGDPSQDYYAEGLTDELITALARNRSLRVVSRTSAMQYKNASQPLTKIAQALGVDGILEGSVNRDANHVHINLQLIYAPTDTHVWAQSYDRDLPNALSLPEELSETIAREAKVASAPARQQRYVDAAAHDAFLHGRYLWVAGNLGESRKYFEKAIQLQPDYAAGWSGLSMNIMAEAPGGAPSGDVVDKAEAAARKAIELDDSLADGHHALAGMYFFGKWDWERADAESRRSLELDPNFSEARHLHSYILFAMNRVQEALEEQKRATEIDPFLRPWALGRAYYRARQYDAALEEFRMRASDVSTREWVHRYLSRVYGFKGMDKESVRELEEDIRINQGEKAAGEIERAYKRSGRRAILQLQLNDLKTLSREGHVSLFDLAKAYADLGMKEETLQKLEHAYREHNMDLVLLQQEPNFDFLHSDERYRGLVRKIGLVPAY